MDVTPDHSTLLGRLAHMLRVRGWIVLLVVVLATGAAAALSLTQRPRYQAESQLLISRTDIGDAAGAASAGATQQSDLSRIVQTQAQLARAPRVARRTLDRAGLRERSANALLKRSSVTNEPGTDLLTLRVSDEDRALATRLAGEYAREIVRAQRAQTAARVRAVRADLVRELGAAGTLRAQARELRGQLRRIRRLGAVGEASTDIVRTPSSAAQTQPQLVRNLIAGLLGGLVLGLVAAALRHALDTRLRRSADVQQRLGLPLLARLLAPPKELARDDRLATLLDPTGPDAESFRVLRTNLAFADIDGGARSIIVSSAVQSEGKSTTIANLALAMARGGKRVILCDCDFRRPQLERFFDLEREPGATGIALGRATMEQALVEVDVGAASAAGVPGFHGPSSNGPAAAIGGGRLELLTTGALPPNVGEFVCSNALRDLLRRLSARCDVLLVDAPPLLQAGDAMALTPHVDAILVVARLGLVRRQMADEVKRLLDTAPIVALGVVVTNADLEPGRGYGYGYYDGYDEEPERQLEFEAPEEQTVAPTGHDSPVQHDAPLQREA